MQGVDALGLQRPGAKPGGTGGRGVLSRVASLLQPGQAVNQWCVLLELVHALQVVLALSHQVGLEVGAAL